MCITKQIPTCRRPPACARTPASHHSQAKSANAGHHPFSQVWNHFLCNAAAAVLVAGGFIAIYFSKAERNKEHFTTWHGQVGLAVTIGIVGQATGSSLLLLSPETLHRLLGVKGTKQFKTMHRYGALVVYLATFSEIFLSFYTNWWNRLVGRETWALFSALTAFTLLTVVVQVRLRDGGLQ